MSNTRIHSNVAIQSYELLENTYLIHFSLLCHICDERHRLRIHEYL